MYAPFAGTLRHRALGLAAALITVSSPAAAGTAVVGAGVLAAAPAAYAAQYTVDACQHPDGAVAPADGWIGSASGSPYTYFNNGCSTGSGLDTAFDSGQAHDYGTQAVWSVSAPAGTTFAGITALRSSSLGPNQPYGSPTAVLYSNLGIIEACGPFGGCFGQSGEISYGLSDASSFAAGVQCGGGPGGVCAAGNTANSIRRIALTLNDNDSPRFQSPPTGSLMSASSIARVRSLNYSAADSGSGLYVQRLYADGTNQAAAGVIDGNSGRCATYSATGHFSYLVPCKTSGSGSLSYDTAGLPDGQHDLALQLSDSAGNTVTHGSWPVLVDNQPPVVGTPALSGTATVGQTLTCTATVSGQSPTTSYKWFREGPDGSDETQIPGASASTYTLTTAEAGRKVICQVIGTDGGGSASARTTLTTPPFNGGATVTGPIGGVSGTPGSSAPITGTGERSRGASNGTNAGPAAKVLAVWLKGGRSTLTDKFNGAPTLRGRVLNADSGQPIGGAILDVIATPSYPGAEPLAQTGLRTTPDGAFTLKLALGISSRTVQVVYRPSLTSPQTGGRAVLNLVVRAGVSFTRLTTHATRLRFSGRLAGGPFPKTGPVVEIQVKKSRTWQVFGSARATSRGRFTVDYRPAHPLPRGVTFIFRARVRADGKYPYAAGVSRPRRAVVR